MTTNITSNRIVEQSGGDVGERDRVGHDHENALTTWLRAEVEEYRTVADLRAEGWASSQGDKFFEEQRRKADNSSPYLARAFYIMMQKIGNEIQDSTKAFELSEARQDAATILDLCMAPGGFLKSAMGFLPGACATAFSLPVANGGHKVWLPKSPNVEVKYLDITMLAEDMGASSARIPDSHPDRSNFLPRHIPKDKLFDLVICDGQVLRMHKRAAYRDHCEARRLASTQLVLGLEHIKPAGTVIILLHTVDALDTVDLIHRFSKFSTVKLFKPKTAHKAKSSFYMIARNLRPEHTEAKTAVEYWREMWDVTTFGNAADNAAWTREKAPDAEMLLEEFGTKLVELSREVWDVQAKGLANSPWLKDGPTA